MIKLINKILRIAFSVFMVFLSVLSPMTVFAASSGSDSNYINQLPFYVGAGWGNSFSSSEISTIVNTCTSAISSNNMDSPYFPDVDAIILYDWDNTYYNFVLFLCQTFFGFSKIFIKFFQYYFCLPIIFLQTAFS